MHSTTETLQIQRHKQGESKRMEKDMSHTHTKKDRLKKTISKYIKEKGCIVDP